MPTLFIIVLVFFYRDFLSNDDVMYVFRIAHKQVMSGRFNFLILVLKDEVDAATLPAELRLYLSKKLKYFQSAKLHNIFICILWEDLSILTGS